MFKLKQLLSFCILCISFCSCQKYYLSLSQQKIDRQYLASSHVGSPDPRLANPPLGQQLILEWQIPRDILEKKPHIILDMIFWDYTKRKETFVIDQRNGFVTYSVLNEDFEKTKGLLTYRAQIETEDHQIYRDWKHQLWVNLIEIDQ